VLFEQCGGDLDKSIEAILQMQKGQGAAAGETEAKEGATPSSLADTADDDKDKATDADKPEDAGNATADRATQELIDEMLAEE
jgi:hypothetical protein